MFKKEPPAVCCILSVVTPAGSSFSNYITSLLSHSIKKVILLFSVEEQYTDLRRRISQFTISRIDSFTGGSTSETDIASDGGVRKRKKSVWVHSYLSFALESCKLVNELSNRLIQVHYHFNKWFIFSNWSIWFKVPIETRMDVCFVSLYTCIQWSHNSPECYTSSV